MVPFGNSTERVEALPDTPNKLDRPKLLEAHRHPSDSDTAEVSNTSFASTSDPVVDAAVIETLPQPNDDKDNEHEEDNASAASSCSSSMSLYIEDEIEQPCPIEQVNLALFLRSEDKEAETAKPERPFSSEEERWQQQVDFWTEMVRERSRMDGPMNLRTAEAWMNLGHVQLQAQDPLEAGKTYLTALKIYQEKYPHLELAVARALDKVGLAASMTHQNLDLALAALSEALKVRCRVLGPSHVDSIDALNNVAGVRLNRQEFGHAAENYRVVLQYRRNVFGTCHASVAVTASLLGRLQADHLHQVSAAASHLRLARDILQRLGLKQSPYYCDAVKKLVELDSL